MGFNENRNFDSIEEIESNDCQVFLSENENKFANLK